MIQVRTGQVTGRDHLARRANGQDALAVRAVGGAVVGVVCDGCGSGASSEVGARLAAQFLVDEAARLLAGGCDVAPLPDMLYGALVRFLRGLVALAAPNDLPCYVRDHLLFTVVGVVVSADGGVVFSAGDGLIAVDDHLEQIDQGNRPAYPAYHLVRGTLSDDMALPTTFAVYPLAGGWGRVAVATDGFEAAVLPAVWGIAHERGLQRLMNVWSEKERRFRDDATIVVVERLPDPATETDGGAGA